jgi:hypothetical protein
MRCFALCTIWHDFLSRGTGAASLPTYHGWCTLTRLDALKVGVLDPEDTLQYFLHLRTQTAMHRAISVRWKERAVLTYIAVEKQSVGRK